MKKLNTYPYLTWVVIGPIHRGFLHILYENHILHEMRLSFPTHSEMLVSLYRFPCLHNEKERRKANIHAKALIDMHSREKCLPPKWIDLS